MRFYVLAKVYGKWTVEGGVHVLRGDAEKAQRGLAALYPKLETRIVKR